MSDYALALQILDEHTSFMWFETGSRVICDPPVLDTDRDIVVIYSGDLSKALQQNGFEITPHEEYPNDDIKACYRKGVVNIIAVEDDAAFSRWAKATSLAKLMNLREKRQRVILFQFLTEGQVRGTGITYA